MFDMPVKDVMARRAILKAAPGVHIRKAARMMADKNAGAVLVIDHDRLVGICTERDIVFRVVARGLDPAATRVADVMTPDPHVVAPDKPFGYALLVMHERGFRHMPVVQDGKVIGMVSARSAMDPDLEDFVSEAARRRHLTEML
ncbi:MAG: CBS domain-containing protein [Betaproteobacteria bacterium]|nr:CBS domain-containing protein [Betaproteobacteria bacterium]